MSVRQLKEAIFHSSMSALSPVLFGQVFGLHCALGDCEVLCSILCLSLWILDRDTTSLVKGTSIETIESQTQQDQLHTGLPNFVNTTPHRARYPHSNILSRVGSSGVHASQFASFCLPSHLHRHSSSLTRNVQSWTAFLFDLFTAHFPYFVVVGLLPVVAMPSS